MFILKIGKNNKLESSDISRLVRMHRTPQDEVAVFYTDTDIPNGYLIYRQDKLPADIARENPHMLKNREFEVMVEKQKQAVRREERLAGKRAAGKTKVR